MAALGYLWITGSRQGEFRAEGRNGADGIPILGFSVAQQAPRDIATGQASGKRQWKPLKIVKEWGAASPQLYSELTSNERLKEVTIDFCSPGQRGFQTIELTDAMVADIRRGSLSGRAVEEIYLTFEEAEIGDGIGAYRPTDINELERIALTFQKIQVSFGRSGKAAQDDWAASA